jgi:hypothetical protein
MPTASIPTVLVSVPAIAIPVIPVPVVPIPAIPVLAVPVAAIPVRIAVFSSPEMAFGVKHGRAAAMEACTAPREGVGPR